MLGKEYRVQFPCTCWWVRDEGIALGKCNYTRDGSIDVKGKGIMDEKCLFSGLFRIIADIQIAHPECRNCAREHIYQGINRSAKIELVD